MMLQFVDIEVPIIQEKTNLERWQGKPAQHTSNAGISSGSTLFMSPAKNLSSLAKISGEMDS